MAVHGYEEDNIQVLLDDGNHTEPTYENIVNAYKTVVAQSRDGDSIFLHYSGEFLFDICYKAVPLKSTILNILLHTNYLCTHQGMGPKFVTMMPKVKNPTDTMRHYVPVTSNRPG